MNAAFIPEDYFRDYSLAEIFGKGDTCEVDLGCGEGSFLLDMAKHYPDRLFLGVERLLGRVKTVCRAINARQIENVRVLRLESRYFLEYILKPGSISRLHYLFPDPWPKKRHYKNRLVQTEFLPALYNALAENGEFLFKTDHEEYFEWVMERMNGSNLFRHVTWEENDFYYPKTDFQQQWEAQGKEIFRARFIKSTVA